MSGWPLAQTAKALSPVAYGFSGRGCGGDDVGEGGDAGGGVGGADGGVEGTGGCDGGAAGVHVSTDKFWTGPCGP